MTLAKLLELKNEVLMMSRANETHKFVVAKARLLSMCSEEEIAQRIDRKQISLFELDPQIPDQRTPKMVRCIRMYQRSAADTILDDPIKIRPIEVIKLSLDYLIEEILDIDSDPSPNFVKPRSGEFTFENIYEFIYGRTRCMRQELSIIGQ